MWLQHDIQTAKVLNEIDPDFIRVRTLTIHDKMPLYNELRNDDFIRSTDEEILAEEKLFVEHLECHANYVSDHITNLLQEIEGKLPQDKGKMLASIDKFQSLSPQERTNFIVGRRVGMYVNLDDLANSRRHLTVEQIIHKLSQGSNQVDNETIHSLMAGFI
jgi:hypothetical protein